MMRSTQIEGVVIDGSQNTAVEKALVPVEVKGAPNEDPFDDSTRYEGLVRNGAVGLELADDCHRARQGQRFQDSGVNPAATHPAMVHALIRQEDLHPEIRNSKAAVKDRVRTALVGGIHIPLIYGT
jgi:hypothetical protein